MRAKANVVMPERAYLYPLGREQYNSVWAVANEKARAADGVVFKFSVWSILNLNTKDLFKSEILIRCLCINLAGKIS